MTIKEKAYPDLVEILTQENEDLKNKYNTEHKSRQEAEGELTIIKGIGNTSPEMEALKEEIKNLKWIKDQDYIFLVDENKKLHKEARELKADNKKLAHEIEDRVNQMRKSGVL